MPNDPCNFDHDPERPGALLRFRKGPLRQRALPTSSWRLALGVTAVTALSSCGEDDNGVTYGKVRPIFDQRCTICHHPSATGMINIQNPFAPDEGLVNARNPWLEGHPEGRTPEFNVVAGEPGNSFLMWKIGDPDAPALDPDVAGDPMPLQLPHLDQDQIQTLETWVANGAMNDQSFEDNVRPIFGNEGQAALGTGGTGRCIHCHYEGTPNPPDLTNPFGPKGLVNVRSTYRADLDRVVPGDVENSFMILKVRATEADALIGAPMPYEFDPLSLGQIETVRQWIVEGARP